MLAPVVEENVWLPNKIGWSADNGDVSKLSWVPAQPRVIFRNSFLLNISALFYNIFLRLTFKLWKRLRLLRLINALLFNRKGVLWFDIIISLLLELQQKDHLGSFQISLYHTLPFKIPSGVRSTQMKAKPNLRVVLPLPLSGFICCIHWIYIKIDY